MTPTIEDVLKKHLDNGIGLTYIQCENGITETMKSIKAAMTEYASINRQGWTRVEEQEKLWDDLIEEVLNIDWYSMTSKDTMQIKELKSKYQLMPLPNKPI